MNLPRSLYLQWIWASRGMHHLKPFQPWQPEQTSSRPPSASHWLSDDKQLYVLLDLGDELDLSAILIPAQAKDPRG